MEFPTIVSSFTWLHSPNPAKGGGLPEVITPARKCTVVIPEVSEDTVTSCTEQATNESSDVIVVDSKSLTSARSSLTDETRTILSLVKLIILFLRDAVSLEDSIGMRLFLKALLLFTMMSSAAWSRIGGGPIACPTILADLRFHTLES